MSCDEWPIRWACDITDVDDDLLDLAREAAQNVLWSMSGRRYGLCEQTEQYRTPCTDECSFNYRRRFGPGVEYALMHQPRNCCSINLTSTPVRAIMEVKVFGEVQDESFYALERSRLKRIGSCWPCEDECDEPPVEVTYRYGIDVPPMGELAMGELACEILAGIRGLDCRLPSNAVSVSRQGVTVDLGDASTLYMEHRIGLPLCDAFIRDTNPNRLKMQSTVHSPDLSRRVR